MELAIEGGRARVVVDGRGLSRSSASSASSAGTWLLSGPEAVPAVSAELPAGDTATVRFRVLARPALAD